jgi:hypothetical protein
VNVGKDWIVGTLCVWDTVQYAGVEEDTDDNMPHLLCMLDN